MNVYDLLRRRALVTRGAAQAIVAALKTGGEPPSRSLELDFSGIQAVAPSFVDELMSGLATPEFATYERLRFKRPPSRLSEKFRAIGRSRNLHMEETDSGDWIVSLPLVVPGADK